jgi:hypothetical protein
VPLDHSKDVHCDSGVGAVVVYAGLTGDMGGLGSSSAEVPRGACSYYGNTRDVAFLDHIYKLRGLPLPFMLDRDRVFTSRLGSELFSMV